MSERKKLLERDADLLKYVADCWELDYPGSGTPAALRRISARLATPASAPVGETTDTERLDWLEANALSWAFINACKTHDPSKNLRATIDTARAAERRDQEEGR